MYRKLLFPTTSIVNRCVASASSSTSKSAAKAVSAKTQSFIDLEARFGAANYHPLPVVIQRGSGMSLENQNHIEYVNDVF